MLSNPDHTICRVLSESIAKFGLFSVYKGICWTYCQGLQEAPALIDFEYFSLQPAGVAGIVSAARNVDVVVQVDGQCRVHLVISATACMLVYADQDIPSEELVYLISTAPLFIRIHSVPDYVDSIGSVDRYGGIILGVAGDRLNILRAGPACAPGG